MHQQREEVLYVSELASSRTWGGSYILYFTSTRVIIEQVIGTGVVFLFILCLGILPGALLLHWYCKRKTKQRIESERQPQQILASHRSNQAIAYDEITKIILKRRIMTRGMGELTIKSRNATIKLGFQRKHFDNILALLSQKLVPEKIESKG